MNQYIVICCNGSFIYYNFIIDILYFLIFLKDQRPHTRQPFPIRSEPRLYENLQFSKVKACMKIGETMDCLHCKNRNIT